MSNSDWGPWKLDPRVAVLYIKTPEYHVDLTRCTGPAGILGWINHMAGKTWMDDKHLAGLARAFDDLFNPHWDAKFPSSEEEVRAKLVRIAHEDDIRPHVAYLESNWLGIAKLPSEVENDPDLPWWSS